MITSFTNIKKFGNPKFWLSSTAPFLCVSSILFDCWNQSNSMPELSSISFDWARLKFSSIENYQHVTRATGQSSSSNYYKLCLSWQWYNLRLEVKNAGLGFSDVRWSSNLTCMNKTALCHFSIQMSSSSKCLYLYILPKRLAQRINLKNSLPMKDTGHVYK